MYALEQTDVEEKAMPRELHGAAGDAELLHVELESGAFHSEADGGAIGASYYPVCFLENIDDLLAFGFFEHASDVLGPRRLDCSLRRWWLGALPQVANGHSQHRAG